MLFRSFFVFLIALTVAACGTSGVVTADSAEEAYDRGVSEFERERYTRAAEFFKLSLELERSGEQAPDVQFYLAQSYYRSKQYLLAGDAYTRFIEFYQSDPRQEEAALERIRSYAALSPIYQLDQTDTHRALQYIEAYTQRFPDGEYVGEVDSIRQELEGKLAKKVYESARLYERRGMYEAAVLEYEKVLSEYPTSELGDEALLGAIRAQVDYADNSVKNRQAERYEYALTLYDRFTQLFASSPLVRDAESLYDHAYARLQGLQVSPTDTTAAVE